MRSEKKKRLEAKGWRVGSAGEFLGLSTTEWTNRIIKIGPSDITKHPNADTLSLVKVFGAYDVVVKTGQFMPGDLAAYVCVDSDLDTSRSEFNFLANKARSDGKYRLRATKIRGIFSQGLVVPTPESISWSEGDDCTAALGLTKYLPPSEREHKPNVVSSKPARKSELWAYDRQVWLNVAGVSLIFILLAISYEPWLWAIPPLVLLVGSVSIKRNRLAHKRPNIPYYDINSLLRVPKDIFVEGEPVIITEKIHGSWAGFCHTGKAFHMKSRTVFIGGSGDKSKEYGFNFDDVWTRVAKKYCLEEKLRNYPNLCLMGEIYGDKIQDLTYGCKDGEVKFAAFDVMDINTRKYMDVEDFAFFCANNDIPVVPSIHVGPYSDSLKQYAEGGSCIANHIREGIVIKPLKERYDNRIGRVLLKLVGQGYLLRKTKDEE